jgi:hypothetical protein
MISITVEYFGIGLSLVMPSSVMFGKYLGNISVIIMVKNGKIHEIKLQ